MSVIPAELSISFAHMGQAKKVGAAVVLLALIVGGLIWRRLRQGPIELRLDPRPSALSAVWPLDRSFAWTFPLPEPGTARGVTLRFQRRSESKAAATQRSGSKPTNTLSVDRSFGTSLAILDKPLEYDKFGMAVPTTGSAYVQLVDLSELDLPTTRPAGNLRIRAGFSISGGSTSIPKSAELPPGRITYWSTVGAGTWNDRKLKLMEFRVDGEDDSVYDYEAFLEERN